MAKFDTTTLTAAQVHPIFGQLSLAISKHIPPEPGEGAPVSESWRWESEAEAACEEYGKDFPLDVTPAEAWIIMRAVHVAVDGDVLSRADWHIGCHLIGLLEEAMVGDSQVHAAVNVMSQLKWAIEYLETNGINHEPVLPVLQQARLSAYHLMPTHGVFVDKRGAPLGGPTVGEVRAVEDAFAKVGLSKEAAHDAVGITPREPVEAE